MGNHGKLTCDGAGVNRDCPDDAHASPRSPRPRVAWRMATTTIPSERPNVPSEGSASLRRQLGLWSAVAVLIGSTIGSGIFRSPAGIADKLPGPLPLMAVWIAG